MPSVRAVPGNYATIQAAHDDASEGDTILLAPGTHAGAGALTKRVHIKGDTADPTGNPVVILPIGTGYSSHSLIFTLAAGTVGDLWIEGVEVRNSGTNTASPVVVNDARAFPAGLLVRFNRVTFRSDAPRSWATLGYGNSARVRARFENCSAAGSGSGGGHLLVGGGAANEIAFVACRTVSAAPLSYTVSPAHDPTTWAIRVEDCVGVDTAGYGIGYGSWYAPQWMGTPYEIVGTVDLPNGMDRSAAQLLLFRRRASGAGVEPYPWLQTAPDASGAYAFRYLPTDRQFYVAMIPPVPDDPAQWVAPGCEGPYSPV